MRLAPLIFLAKLDDRTIVLDLARDRYLALAPRLARAAEALLANEGTPSDDHAIARAKLLELGLLDDQASAARSGPRAADTALPLSTVWPSPSPETDVGGFVSVMTALSQAAHGLRFHRFDALIAAIARQPCGRARGTQQAALDAYFAARPWFPQKPICRLDALALCLHMRRRGHPVDLVFGVKLEKFAAHCWVQSGTQVLNEPHELAARFTPIMVA